MNAGQHTQNDGRGNNRIFIEKSFLWKDISFMHDVEIKTIKNEKISSIDKSINH